MSKHKRRKRLKANRHKKRTWQKWAFRLLPTASLSPAATRRVFFRRGWSARSGL